MFFPKSHGLPVMGDKVRLDHNPEPYTVGMVTPDRTWYHLLELDEPVRVECLAWYPRVGDRVEVLFCPYFKWLQGRFDHHWSRWWAEPGERRAIEQTLDRIKAAMKNGVRYRVGDLMKVEGDLVEVQFGNSTEVLPMDCISVAKREIKIQPPADALPPESSPFPAGSGYTLPAPAHETRPMPDKIPALHP